MVLGVCGMVLGVCGVVLGVGGVVLGVGGVVPLQMAVYCLSFLCTLDMFLFSVLQ